MSYSEVRQSVDELRDVESSPAVSMGQWLERSGETERFRRLSIYEERGRTREAARVLWMNGEALAIWRAMGRPAEARSERHRPPRGALLAFGVPYTE